MKCWEVKRDSGVILSFTLHKKTYKSLICFAGSPSVSLAARMRAFKPLSCLLGIGWISVVIVQSKKPPKGGFLLPVNIVTCKGASRRQMLGCISQ